MEGMKKCIVTFVSLEQERYVKGFSRLKQSLRKVGFDGDFLAFHECSDIDSPEHPKSHSAHIVGDGYVPYAFKPYAIKKAMELGYELILWCDAPVYAEKDLTGIFNHIEEKGYIFFDNIGYSIGDYTSDKCLKKQGMTRKESYYHKMIMACCMGLNVNDENAMQFFLRYFDAANDGVSYPGKWDNADHSNSFDLRCRGHRHDQSVASIIIAQMGLDIHVGHETFFTYFEHPGMMPVAKTVSLFSQGF